MVDVAIIGTGVAGLTAALTVAARNKTMLLFGEKKLGGKLTSTTDVKNFLGFFNKSSEEIQEDLSNHLKSLGIEVCENRITNIYKMGDHFSLISGSNFFDAKTVVLASGISFGKPIPGETDFLGRGVSYCATCDGMLFKNKNVAVISFSKNQEDEANFLGEICSEVFYFPMYKNFQVDKKIHVVENARDFEIKGGLKVEKLIYDQAEIDVDCVFILRDNIPPAQLIAGIEMDGNHIKTDRQMQTNIPGFFAAGDITGTPYQFSKASGEGNVAALSAVKFLDNLKRG